jgi:hypothetical protein
MGSLTRLDTERFSKLPSVLNTRESRHSARRWGLVKQGVAQSVPVN